MPPDAALAGSPRRAMRLPQAWRVPLLHVALAWAALAALFASDWAAMARLWWDSSTYNHILLIPFILAWLVKLRATELARLTPQAWWPGVLVFGGALFLWLLGRIAGINVASQLGAVASLQAAVLLILGPRVSFALLFPLAYMLFMVPIGDEFVPTLQMITARLTIEFIHLSGVPAHIDGVFIDTPVGLFEVAEACSGVKFLVAMVALGALVAHVCFRDWKRRALFMAAAVALPILANGVRAWGTIYVAQSQGIEFAVGFDHIIYGWVFFAAVVAALLGVSWRFFDREPEEPFVDVERIEKSRLLGALARAPMASGHALAAIAVMALAAMGWSSAAQRLRASLPTEVSLPAVSGWERVACEPRMPWEPRATGADHRLLDCYRDAAGREVTVFYALYSSQESGREVGAPGQGALIPKSDWRWLAPGPALAGGKGDRVRALGVQRLAVTWYRTGDVVTGSNLRLKLANMADQLFMRPNATAMLILSGEESADQSAQEAVDAFLATVGPPAAWMDRIAQLP